MKPLLPRCPTLGVRGICSPSDWSTASNAWPCIGCSRRKEKPSIGKVIFEVFEAMADYPKWLLCLVGSLKYNEEYVNRLREATTKPQEHRYPGDWVAKFIEGDGGEFDYGILEILNRETGPHDRYRLIEDLRETPGSFNNNFEENLQLPEESKSGILEKL